jgi:hypothetical protein
VHLRIAGEPGGQHVPYPLSLHPAGPVQVLPVGFAVVLDVLVGPFLWLEQHARYYSSPTITVPRLAPAFQRMHPSKSPVPGVEELL